MTISDDFDNVSRVHHGLKCLWFTGTFKQGTFLMAQLVGLSGSLRKGSYNTGLLQAAAKLLPVGDSITVHTIHGIPLYATAMLPGSPFFRTDAVKLSAVALPTNSASAANRTEFVVKVERRGFEGEVSLALEGVPAGVVATVQPVAAKAKEATVQLLVTEKAEAGKEHQIAVTAAYTHNDRTWRQKTTPVSLTIAAPAVETASTNAPATPKPTP